MNPTESKASRIYFITGTISLFFMALFWSVDDSLIYIFLGIASACFFLGFYFRPQTQEAFSRKSASSKEEPSFESFFKTKTQKATTTVTPQRTKSIVVFVFIGMFVFFFGIVFSLVFSDDDSSVSFDFDKAEQFRWNADYDSAKTYYRRDLAVDPEHVEALTGLGNVFISQSNYDSSQYYFKKAVAIDPSAEEARYGVALSLYYKKDYRSSLKETFPLIKEDPDYSDAVLLAGDNYYMQDRYDSAMYYYTSEYDRGTKTPGLYHVMAYIYDTKGETDKAKALYKETLGMDSTRVGIYDRMAELEPSNATFYKAQAKRWRDAGYN